MTASPSDNRLPPFAPIAAVAWTLLLAVSLGWNLHQEWDQSLEMAFADARSNLNKDLSFRRWATRHGGVYVPVTDTQKSVPWLAHVPGRDVTTSDGRALTLLNPASMLRQVMDSYADEYGIRGRITGLKYLNPGNAPDTWEREQLESFVRREKTEVWAIAELGGRPHLRFLRAMTMDPGCEKCHAILGYQLGDVRGATGINLPLAPYEQRYEAARATHLVSHLAIWLLGLAGIGWAGRTVRRNEQERARNAAELADYRQHLEQLVEERTAELAGKNAALESTLGQLKTAQKQLVQSEKLSSLGALVAGVAHELNTPIGNARTVASALGEQMKDFHHQIDDNQLKRSTLTDFVHHVDEGTQLLERNLVRAAELIHSFKQVAADRASSQRRDFDLRQVLEEVVSTLRPSLKKTQYRIELDAQPGIVLDSFPGPLGQVVVNLIDNAVLHGFAGRAEGTVRVAGALAEDGRVRLTVEDDGQGIPAQNLPRIYDPFFTTRLGQGGSGLGLNIVHNIVTALLGGEIEVRSESGRGTRFEMRFPLRAPERDAAAATSV